MAGALTEGSLLPQLFKEAKEKKGATMAWGYLFGLLAGLAAWICYGLLKADYPTVITNGFSMLINLVLMVLINKYQRYKAQGT